jgi:hypothetical protein
VRKLIVVVVVLAICLASCSDSDEQDTVATPSTGDPATLWLNNTGLQSDADWGARATRSCDAGVWEPDPAVVIAKEFLAEDGFQGEAQDGPPRHSFGDW